MELCQERPNPLFLGLERGYHAAVYIRCPCRFAPKGIVPAKGTLVWDEAEVLGEIWGSPGRVIFLLVGVATLFGTQLALVDGIGQSIR